MSNSLAPTGLRVLGVRFYPTFPCMISFVKNQKSVCTEYVSSFTQMLRSPSVLGDHLAKSSQVRLGLPSTAVAGDKFGVSDRDVAAIASSILHDVGPITSNKSDLVVDENKLRREKAKVRKDLKFQALSEAQALPLKGLYFDGRKDSTLIEERVDTKTYTRKAKEERLCLTEELSLRYITHLTLQDRFSRLLSDILKGSQEIFLSF
ncbi:hypothetical protein AVEN_230255-1 [Araneus ventricosus]|uniref:Uncharacterized protein n=1 Tax=Araneus ventricosus TaxID=182803 RepID=A0A4Y2NC08_ARAVE|nr:hypothetical protein AVEN_230255-1 [Araneus ventricosus]